VNQGVVTAVVVILIVFATMLAEARLSRAHERTLRAAGAFEPPGDVYGVMQIAYPTCFLLMAAESLVRDATSPVIVPGIVVFIVAKALKWWAIVSLGTRWSFRVLVVPGAALVDAGPYRWLRHPNYLAVLGELIGVAVMLGVPWTGTLACLAFGALMRARIRVEERALGIRGDRRE
jgi:methyltransferase